VTELLPGRLSPDRRWWWTGTSWTSAYSGDGRWKWDGARWQPIRPAWTLWLFVLGAVTAAVGALVRLAGTYERYLTSRPVPPGWTNYQPPWANPAYRTGLVTLIAGLAIMITTLLLRLALAQRTSGRNRSPDKHANSRSEPLTVKKFALTCRDQRPEPSD
jgi:hypothetical protein